jgi:hypothetical protein
VWKRTVEAPLPCGLLHARNLKRLRVVTRLFEDVEGVTEKGVGRSRRPSDAITYFELAAAGAECEEADSASAHALRCRNRATRNATARLTSASNYAFAGFSSAMDRTVDRVGGSCGR